MAFLMKSPSYTPENPEKSVKQLYSWAFQLNEYLKYMFSHLDEESFTQSFLASVAQGNTETIAKLESEVESLRNQINEENTWQVLPLVNSKEWNEDFLPYYTKNRNLVFVTGAISPKANIGKGVSVNVAILPEGYRPSAHLAYTVPFSGGAVRLDVYKDGRMEVKNNTSTEIVTGKLVSVTVSFAV